LPYERHGCNPNATHIRRIVVWEKPVSAAIERIDQCVASTGVVRNVRSITAAGREICAREIF